VADELAVHPPFLLIYADFCVSEYHIVLVVFNTVHTFLHREKADLIFVKRKDESFEVVEDTRRGVLAMARIEW
jgi:hypothetical protein